MATSISAVRIVQCLVQLRSVATEPWMNIFTYCICLRFFQSSILLVKDFFQFILYLLVKVFGVCNSSRPVLRSISLSLVLNCAVTHSNDKSLCHRTIYLFHILRSTTSPCAKKTRCCVFNDNANTQFAPLRSLHICVMTKHSFHLRAHAHVGWCARFSRNEALNIKSWSKYSCDCWSWCITS